MSESQKLNNNKSQNPNSKNEIHAPQESQNSTKTTNSNQAQNPHFEKSKLFSEKLEVHNLSLGSCGDIQSLYELHRERNKEILSNAALIVTESNSICIHNSQIGQNAEQIPLAVLLRNLYFYYKSLAALQKSVVSILLPVRAIPNRDEINGFHKKMCAKFGINLIDMTWQEDEFKIVENFTSRIDERHPQQSIMREFGRQIALNLANFAAPKSLPKGFKAPKFRIITPKDMSVVCGGFEEIHQKNSMYDEVAYKMTKPTAARFAPSLKGHFLLAFHSWEDGNSWEIESKFIVKNTATSILKSNCALNVVLEFHNDFVIDDESFILYKIDETTKFTEHFHLEHWDKPECTKFLNIIAFLLMEKREFLAQKREFEAALNEPPSELDARYDFARLVPNIELYRQIVDEYCEIMDPRKMQGFNELKAKDEAFDYLRTSKFLKICLKIGGKILPSRKARKHCRRLLGLFSTKYH